MINATVTKINDSIKIEPYDGYSIRIAQENGTYIYSDGFVQFPLDKETKLLPLMDTILISDIPSEPTLEENEEIDYKSAYEEITEVIENA